MAARVIPIATGGDSPARSASRPRSAASPGLKGTYGRIPQPRRRSLAQLTVSGVIGADLADTVLATSIASGPDPRDPAALPHWPVPTPAERQLTVGFSADLGYARPDAAVAALVAGRLQALAAAGMIRLREVTVRLADPAPGWLPLTALDRGQLTEVPQLTRAHEVRRHNDHELAALFGDIDVLVTPTTPQTAFPLGDYEANLPAGDLCWAFNLSGHPAVTVPASLLDGLPVGLQAVAAQHRDDLAVWTSPAWPRSACRIRRSAGQLSARG